MDSAAKKTKRGNEAERSTPQRNSVLALRKSKWRNAVTAFIDPDAEKAIDKIEGSRALDLFKFQNLSPTAQTYAISEFSKTPRCVIDPNGWFHNQWGLLLLVATLVTAVITPVEIAFVERTSKTDSSFLSQVQAGCAAAFTAGSFKR